MGPPNCFADLPNFGRCWPVAVRQDQLLRPAIPASILAGWRALWSYQLASMIPRFCLGQSGQICADLRSHFEKQSFYHVRHPSTFPALARVESFGMTKLFLAIFNGDDSQELKAKS